ncbi:MAG: IS1 family transposase [Dehalococcoidia bacterium]|nr:IS1 family transposase [Dehalococcoidia bacterium]
MNKLKIEKQTAVIRALVEGSSIRSTERMTGVHRDTIMRLMVQVGDTCGEVLDHTMRGLHCQRIEVDEIWAYVGKKQRHVQDGENPAQVGDFYTWVAMDADSKLVPSFRVGKRDAANAHAFITDLASRLENRVQLSSDALRLYVDAVEAGFGPDVDYAQIVKAYEAEPLGPGRYSPPQVVSTSKFRIQGKPDMALASTSYVERGNLTMRMSMRRFTRLTNAFSKKVENLKAAVNLHFAYYNLVRFHKTVRMPPAMAAGVTHEPWSIQQLVELSN